MLVTEDTCVDEDVDIGEEMVSELGIDPAIDVDSNQRAELLRSWHTEPSKDEEKEKD